MFSSAIFFKVLIPSGQQQQQQQPKKENAHKTETFLLFGKICKKFIITGISIIYSIIIQ